MLKLTFIDRKEMDSKIQIVNYQELKTSPTSMVKLSNKLFLFSFVSTTRRFFILGIQFPFLFLKKIKLITYHRQ